MTEVEKLSQGIADQGDHHVEIADPRRALRQQLESLNLAGLSHIPAGRGEYSFDWTQLVPATDSTEQSPSPITGPASERPERSQAGSVRETIVESIVNKTVASPSKVVDIPPTVAAAPLSTTQNPVDDSDPWGPSLQLENRKSALRVLQEQVAGCTKCEELSSGRTQTVFGVGNPAARLVFVGEGPGAQEDQTGEPFVGEAGKLLDKIMGACGLARSDVFILNAVKCRPPGNRNPGQDELANCWGYAEQQLEIIQPEFICCLGSVAARTLLKTTESLGRLRKRFHAYRGSRVLVTYHPAYLLRTPSAKRHVWDDMKMLMKEMGVDLSN